MRWDGLGLIGVGGSGSEDREWGRCLLGWLLVVVVLEWFGEKEVCWSLGLACVFVWCLVRHWERGSAGIFVLSLSTWVVQARHDVVFSGADDVCGVFSWLVTCVRP
jgi:hypothetical protein